MHMHCYLCGCTCVVLLLLVFSPFSTWLSFSLFKTIYHVYRCMNAPAGSRIGTGVRSCRKCGGCSCCGCRPVHMHASVSWHVDASVVSELPFFIYYANAMSWKCTCMVHAWSEHEYLSTVSFCVCADEMRFMKMYMSLLLSCPFVHPLFSPQHLTIASHSSIMRWHGNVSVDGMSKVMQEKNRKVKRYKEKKWTD